MIKQPTVVIDDFLDAAAFKELAKFVSGPEFPWFYSDLVSLPPADATIINDPMAVETAGLSHVMYDQVWNVKSFGYAFFKNFFQTMEEKLNLHERDIIRARASLKWPKLEYTKDNYNLPHVDFYFPHESLIYYINDSDGDTFIFDQWFDDNQGIWNKKYSIQERITPKANRLVWIDGLHYHTASNPINYSKRIIININLNKKNEN